jgi:hypothetical protein
MERELAVYIVMYLLTLIFIVKPSMLTKEKNFALFWIVVAMGFSVVIRSTIGLVDQSDIDQYIYLMGSDSDAPYFVKEFIFWYSIRYLYDLLGDGATVFVVLDFILFIFLYKGFSLNRRVFFPSLREVDVRYVLFALFLFFPYVQGMHLVYRQILATAIFIYSMGFFGENRLIKGSFFLVTSVLVHNAAVAFAPLLLFVTNRKKYKFLGIFSLFFYPVIFSMLLITDNGFLTRRAITIHAGENIAYLYLLVLLILAFIIAFIETKYKRHKKQEFDVFFVGLIVVISIYSFFVFNTSSGLSERIVYYVFAIIFPILAYYFETRFSEKILIRIVFFHVSILPILTFHNSTIY